MIVHQLDLFGGPLRPPKKIKVDDDAPAEESKLVVEKEVAQIPGPTHTEEKPIEKVLVETLTGMETYEPLAHFLDDAPITNGVEWSPESDAEMVLPLLEPGNTPVDNDDELMPDLIPELEGYIDEDPVFTNEAIFTGSIAQVNSNNENNTSGKNDDTGGNEEIGPTNIVADTNNGIESYDQLSHFPDDNPVTNGIEWSPESDEELAHPEREQIHDRSANEEELMPESIPELEGYLDEEPAFTNEAIFTESIVDENNNNEGNESGESMDKGTSQEILPSTIVVETGKAGSSKIKRVADDDGGLNIPADEELFKRQYYNMRETASMFGVNQSLLRFWENEFDILQPKKNKKGDRYFRPVDIKNLVLIYNLLRIRKFTLEGAKDYLNSHKKAADSFELVNRLEKLKSFLFELKAGL